MNAFSMAGAGVVLVALALYTTGFFTERAQKKVSARVLRFYTLGVIFDITATVLMIIGSSNGMLTLHGVIGYSSLLAMLTDTVLLYRFNRIQGPEKAISPGLHRYSMLAYIWWVLAFITGGLLVALK